MPDHKKMYLVLCDAVAEALDKMPRIVDNTYVRKRLVDGMQAAEDLYVDTDEQPETEKGTVS